MADHSPDDWLPAGWTVSVRKRPTGKKDKHYFSPSGLKFNSKVEVTRYLKTRECSPPQLKEEKDAVFEESAKDTSAGAEQNDCPNSQEKKKSGLELSSHNQGSPESEEKYYSAEETPADDCGNAVRSGSLNSEDKENTEREQAAENYDSPNSREYKAVAVEETPENVSSMEKAKSNLEQSTKNCSSPQPNDVKNVNAEESADQICSNAAENGSHQSKEEENAILEGKRKDGSSPCSKGKKKTRPKQCAYVVVERGVAEGLPDGWIKEVKAKKRNNTVRRDPYYIDPVSGYVFRSKKDALRYITTGVIGRHAFKRKDESDIELEDDKGSSPVETKKQKLNENGTSPEDQRSKQSKEQKLDANGTSTKGQSSIQSVQGTFKGVIDSADIAEAVPDTSECVSVTGLRGPDLPKLRGSERNGEMYYTNETDSTPANGAEVRRDEQPLGKTEDMPALADIAAARTDGLPSEKTEGTSAQAEAAGVPQNEQPLEKTEESPASTDETDVLQPEQLLEKTEGTASPADEAGVPQDEQSSEKAEEMPGNKTMPQGTPKSRKKKFHDLPRRTSSRLAGVAVDLSVEVTKTRAQRGAVGKLEEGEASGMRSVTTTDRSRIQPQHQRARRGNKLSEPMTSVGPSEASLGADELKRDQTDEGEVSGGKSITTRDHSQIQAQPKRARTGNKLSEPMTSVGPSEVTSETDELKRDQADECEASEGKSITTRDRSQIQAEPKRARRGKKSSDPMISVGLWEASLGADELKRDKADEEETNVVKSVTTRDHSQIQAQPKRARRGKKLSEPSEASLGADELKRDQVDDEKKGRNVLSLPQQNMFIENHNEKSKAEDESEENPALPFELPSGDILSDPCIEFAIKTLTGIDFDTSRSTPKSSNDSNSSKNAASLKVQAEHMEIERGVDKKQAAPDRNTSKACNFEEKAGAEIPSSSLSNLSFGDAWQDPCIEFAIKTLTGAIPVEYDLDIPDLMRQQMRSSQIQESTEVALTDVGLDNFCQTDLLWQHSTDASSDKTAYRRQGVVGPVGQQPGNNVDIQRTGGVVLRKHHQDHRGNKYQR